MRLLIFSDIHTDLKALDRLLDTGADYYIAAGDMLTWAQNLERVGTALSKRAERLYIMPGNHESEENVNYMCRRFGLKPLHSQAIEVAGHHIVGLGYSSPTPFKTPGEYTEEEIGRRLQPFSGLKPMVLVCHCPPLNTPLDRIRDGLHAGSSSIRQFIEDEQPRYFFCGHIHEAEGVRIQMGDTTAVNVGKRGFLLEL